MQRDLREVSFQRVVNIVERRTTVSRPDVEHGQDGREDWYSDRYEDNLDYQSFHRDSPHRQEEDDYYGGSNRDDAYLRRQVEIRSRGRNVPYHGGRGRGMAPLVRAQRARGSRKLPPLLSFTDRGGNKDDYKSRDPYIPLRERSPVRREALPAAPTHSGFDARSRSFSPDGEKGYTYQQLQQRHRPRASTSNTSSGAEDVSSHRSSASTQENPPASVTESVDVVVAASSEPNPTPNPTPEDNLKARRSQVIASKALAIEELYKQDCQTFGTVVKMLVSKEPSLDPLLQSPLRENLLELKQRCLDDLKQFIKELDELKPPEITT